MRTWILAAVLATGTLAAADPMIEMELRRMEALVGKPAASPPANAEEWYTYWHAAACGYEKEGQLRQAGGAYWAATFFLFDHQDPRYLEATAKSRECLKGGLNPAIQTVAIPYEEGHTLPGYLLLAQGNEKRPLVIIQTGFDGTVEELLFFQMEDIVAKGFHCLAIEGPGQGRLVNEQRLTFRPDWESVIRPVIDYAVEQPQVDGDRIALWGISFGGHLATRAAAMEPRIKATVVNGGIFDFYAHCISQAPSSLSKQLDDPRAHPVINRMIGRMMEEQLERSWFFKRGMASFGANSPAELLIAIRPFRLQEVIGQIRCPVLVCDSEDDFLVGSQPKQLFDALPGSKDYILFTRAEGAGAHCQAGAYTLSNDRILSWLEKKIEPSNNGITMQPKMIGLIWIVVKDIKKAVKYYTETVGLKLEEFHEEYKWAELSAPGGGARLGIGEGSGHQEIPAGSNAVITMSVANIDIARADLLKKGAKLLGEVIEVPGHVKMQTVVDADGNHFQICEVLHA